MMTILYGAEENCISYVKNKFNQYKKLTGQDFFTAYKKNINLHDFCKVLVIDSLFLDRYDEEMQQYAARIFKYYEVYDIELYLINPAKISVKDYGDALYYNLQRAKIIHL